MTYLNVNDSQDLSFISIWFSITVPQGKKLTFMYLANDVIQNSKKKGPEYGKEFGKTLKNAFTHIGETCSNDEKTLGSLGRILKIWEERGVYDEKLIQEYRNAINNVSDNKDNVKAGPISKRKSIEVAENGRDSNKKQKTSTSGGGGGGGGKEHGKRETIEVNGTVETHVILSPKVPTGKLQLLLICKRNQRDVKTTIKFHIFSNVGDPPEPEELIKALLSLENSASSDANIRERIANLPPEVSEVALLSRLEDKEAAAKLIAQVNS